MLGTVLVAAKLKMNMLEHLSLKMYDSLKDPRETEDRSKEQESDVIECM